MPNYTGESEEKKLVRNLEFLQLLFVCDVIAPQVQVLQCLVVLIEAVQVFDVVVPEMQLLQIAQFVHVLQVLDHVLGQVEVLQSGDD